MPERAALRLYEEGYVEHLRRHPELLRWLCDNFADVYDTGLSNVQSGFDYSIQELPKQGRHLHDIAIRKAVHILGEKFKADRLLQVRGPRSEGFCLSPGEVPFHKPEMIPKVEADNDAEEQAGKEKEKEKAVNKTWWRAGSIEDFYQRTRRIVVPEFRDTPRPTGHVGSAQERPETYCARIASRFFLRMLPILPAADVEHGQLNDLPWMVDSHSFPTDTTGLPRPFTQQEDHLVAQALYEQLIHFCGTQEKEEKSGASVPGQPLGSDEDGPAVKEVQNDSLSAAKTPKKEEKKDKALVPFIPLSAFKNARQFLAILNKRAVGGEPTHEESRSFPDFSDMQVWSKALPHFWTHTYGEGWRPLHLARDGWIPMEYLSYRAGLSIGERQSPKRSVYIPGTAKNKEQTKNERGNCTDLERVVEKLTDFANPNIS